MASSPLHNGVYYPSWRCYKGHNPSSIDTGTVTHIYYAFVHVNEDGTLRPLDEYSDFQKPIDGEQGALAALRKLKAQRPGLRTLASIGGGSGSAEFPIMAANSTAVAAFARSCRDFVDRWGFDGVDIDWEHPETPHEGKAFVAMLEGLRRALPLGQYLVSSSLPVGEYTLKHIDLKAAGRLLDHLNLMGYDFCGPWTDVSGHHAQLFVGGVLEATYPTLRKSTHGGVEYLLSRHFPREKIILGVPLYTRSFEGAYGVGQPFRGTHEMEHREIPAEWLQRASIDRTCCAASYVDNSPGGKGFMSFDVPETIRQKAQYVKCMGLGGLFYWCSDGDRCGPDSLIRAGYEALYDKQQST